MTVATDANFRALGVWISDGFAAFGWTLQGSVFATGTNWTDVTTPAANNTARVTEVWAMADSLQATAPLYLRIEYGRSAANVFGLRITCATGWTSGVTLAGTTLVDTGATYFGGNTANANSMTHRASGDTNRINFGLAIAGTSWASGDTLFFSYERRIDGSGTPVGTGFLLVRNSTTTIAVNASLQNAAGPTGSTTFTSVTAGHAGPYSAANLQFDSKIAIMPLMWCLGPIQAGLGGVLFPVGAYANNAEFSVTMFGAAHNYASMGDWSSFSSVTDFAMRYE